MRDTKEKLERLTPVRETVKSKIDTHRKTLEKQRERQTWRVTPKRHTESERDLGKSNY